MPPRQDVTFCWFMDETFSVPPNVFDQLYVLEYNWVIGQCHALLHGRTQAKSKCNSKAVGAVYRMMYIYSFPFIVSKHVAKYSEFRTDDELQR